MRTFTRLRTSLTATCAALVLLKSDRKWRRAYVYTPPDYESNRGAVPRPVSAARLGRERAGLDTQGHVDLIMDNLIAEKKAKPMIVVMDNLNAVRPGEDAALYAGAGRDHRPVGATPRRRRRARRRGRRAVPVELGRDFTDMMFTDLIPMIERTYRARRAARIAPWRASRWAACSRF